MSVDVTKLTPEELERRQAELQTVVDSREKLADEKQGEVDRLRAEADAALRLRQEATAELAIRKLGGIR